MFAHSAPDSLPFDGTKHVGAIDIKSNQGGDDASAREFLDTSSPMHQCFGAPRDAHAPLTHGDECGRKLVGVFLKQSPTHQCTQKFTNANWSRPIRSIFFEEDQSSSEQPSRIVAQTTLFALNL